MFNQKEWGKKYYLKNRNKIINYAINRYKNITEEQKIKRKEYKKKYNNSLEGKIMHNKNSHKNNINKYKISFSEYQNLVQKQNNLCAICNEKCLTGNNLSIDHNHITGKIRGLLCRKCNTGLGMFNDNIIYLNNAMEYLKA